VYLYALIFANCAVKSKQSSAATAAINQAKLASKFIGDSQHHMEAIQMGKTMSGRRASQPTNPHQGSNHLKTGMDDKQFMQAQLASARKKKTDSGGGFQKIPGEFRALLDIDGDGTIDQEEYKLMEELENVIAEDIDGDGMVSVVPCDLLL
jgi:hypothetical protein